MKKRSKKHSPREIPEVVIKFEEKHTKNRSYGEVLELAVEFQEKLWYHRYRMNVLSNRLSPCKSIRESAQENAKRIEQTYDKSELSPYTDFELGFLCGKLSTTRWFIGDDWDNLDT